MAEEKCNCNGRKRIRVALGEEPAGTNSKTITKLQSTITKQDEIIKQQQKDIKTLIDKGTTLHGWIQNNATLELNPGFALDAWRESVHNAMKRIDHD